MTTDPRTDVEQFRVTAQYTAPIGGGTVTLTVQGVELSEEDYDNLIELVKLFQKNRQRAEAMVKVIEEES